MNLKEYQLETRKTAVYPDQYKIAYPCLGLIGEAGELLLTNTNEDVIKEVGDCLWYCANLMTDLHLELIEVPLQDYISRNQILFEIAEKVKKILRDGSTEEKKLQVQRLVGQLVYCYRTLTQYILSDFDQVLQTNLDKLKSRKDRGVLGGSGDHR